MAQIAIEREHVERRARRSPGRDPDLERLRAIRAELRKPDLEDRELFQRAVQVARDLLGYSDVDLAEAFNCSRMTANRWVRGEAAPFPGLRAVIYKDLGKAMDRQIKVLTARS